MDRTLSVVVALALALGGCGSKTGLDLTGAPEPEEPEEPPEAPFPCTYGVSGEPRLVGHAPPGGAFTAWPSLAWTGEHLGVGWELVYPTFERRVGTCETDEAARFECDENRMEPGGPRPHVAWNGESYGVLAGADPLSAAIGVVLVTFDWSEPGTPSETFVVDPTGIAPAGLGWLDGHYVAAWETGGLAVVQSLGLDGAPLEAPLAFVPDTDRAPDARDLALAADGEAALVAYLDRSRAPVVQLVAGAEPFVLTLDGEALSPPAIGVREGWAGLAWVEAGPSPDVTELRFAVISVESGRAGEPATIATVDGAVVDLAARAVWDGFLVARTETGPSGSHHVVTPMRFAEGLGVEVRREILLAELPARAEPLGIALGDDGHIAFVGTVQPAYGADQVHLSVLSCHR